MKIRNGDVGQTARLSLEDVVALTAVSPGGSGMPLGDLLHDDAIVTMSAATLEVGAAVLDDVLDGTSTPVFDPAAPVPVPALFAAADPGSPDAVTRPADLERLASVTPHAVCRTLAGANHLIHLSVGQREPSWSLVDEFLGQLNEGARPAPASAENGSHSGSRRS